MTWMILGLVLFLGAHSVRICADGWRTRAIARIGEYPWKGLYSLVSLAGFALLVWGYGQTREVPVVLYHPPYATYYVTSALMLISFVLWAAAYVPRNHIKAVLGHPMVAGVKLWAFAHLLSNGRLADVILFGAFLAWASADFIAARGRDRAAGIRHPVGQGARTAAVVGAGAAAWVLFALWAHQWLIGVPPLPR